MVVEKNPVLALLEPPLVELDPDRGATAESRLRLVVACDQALVAEAVRVALSSRGIEAVVIPWTVGPEPTFPLGAALPQAGLLISDLESLPTVRQAQELVSRTPVPWLALTSAPRGSAWGAMLESGVRLVLPSATSLGETVTVLDRLAAGHGPPAGPDGELLIHRWQEERTEREVLFARVQSLTPRERTVLRLLFTGRTVRTIADLLGVSEATARSHVRSMLRKMGVNSQLAAVAAYGWLQDTHPGARYQPGAGLGHQN